MAGTDSNRSGVSVVVPVHNGARFVEQALESIFAQSVQPGEVIVVDDGSTDETPEILERLADRAPVDLRLITQENRGVAHARNRAVELATGELIAFLDHDDVWHENKLARQLEEFRADSELVLAFCACRIVDGGEPRIARVSNWDTEREALMLRLIEGCVIITCSMVMMRREAFDRLPPFDEGLTVTSDWAMYWEMAAAGMKMAYVDEPLLDYRVHDTNLTSDELRIGNTGLAMMDRIFARPEQLPPAVRRRKPWAYARWHLNTAEWALRAGRRDLARRHILLAARSRPLSIRPGWVRMLGIGSPPRQDPPSPREAPG